MTGVWWRKLRVQLIKVGNVDTKSEKKKRKKSFFISLKYFEMLICSTCKYFSYHYFTLRYAKWPDTGHLTSILSECFWRPLFQTNWISRLINIFFWKPDVFKHLYFKYKTFLSKYHILPSPEYLNSTSFTTSEQNGALASATVSQAINPPKLVF